MSCLRCGKSSQNCGCKDGPFTTVPGCDCPQDINCPTPQKCVEFVDTACVLLKDYQIADTGFEENTTLAQMLQIISLYLTNPSCITPGNSCLSTPYVYPYQIISSSISIAWKASPTAISYQVEYKQLGDASFTLL